MLVAHYDFLYCLLNALQHDAESMRMVKFVKMDDVEDLEGDGAGGAGARLMVASAPQRSLVSETGYRHFNTGITVIDIEVDHETAFSVQERGRARPKVSMCRMNAVDHLTCVGGAEACFEKTYDFGNVGLISGFPLAGS